MQYVAEQELATFADAFLAHSECIPLEYFEAGTWHRSIAPSDRCRYRVAKWHKNVNEFGAIPDPDNAVPACSSCVDFEVALRRIIDLLEHATPCKVNQAFTVAVEAVRKCQ
jgi:hypothetical protein